jgi:hypothetical protein
VEAAPDVGWAHTATDPSTSPELQFQVDFGQPGTYRVWVRALAKSSGSDSVHVGLDGIRTGQTRGVDFAHDPNAWSWSNRLSSGRAAEVVVTAPGVHTVNLWMREDGILIDRVVLAIDPNFAPSDVGPEASLRTGEVAEAGVASPTAPPEASPTEAAASVTPEPTATAAPTLEPTATPAPEPTATPTLAPEPTLPPTEEPTAPPSVPPAAAPAMTEPTITPEGV